MGRRYNRQCKRHPSLMLCCACRGFLAKRILAAASKIPKSNLIILVDSFVSENNMARRLVPMSYDKNHVASSHSKSLYTRERFLSLLFLLDFLQDKASEMGCKRIRLLAVECTSPGK